MTASGQELNSPSYGNQGSSTLTIPLVQKIQPLLKKLDATLERSCQKTTKNNISVPR